MGPACHTRECRLLEQEEKGRTQNAMDTWHSYREEEGDEEFSCPREIEEESQRGAPIKAQEDFPGGHVCSGSCGRALSKMRW